MEIIFWAQVRFLGNPNRTLNFAQLVYHILAVDAQPKLELLRGDIYKPLAATFSKHGGGGARAGEPRTPSRTKRS